MKLSYLMFCVDIFDIIDNVVLQKCSQRFILKIEDICKL